MAGAAWAWSAARLPDSTVRGTQAGQQVGGAVYAQADLNRDGRLDLISSAAGVQRRGVVEVRYGTPTGFRQQADFSYQGPMEWALVGTSPMAMDVNGDGWPDLVVGAYGYSGSAEFSGAVLVFLGGANGFGATPSQVIEGVQPNGYFGFAMRALGDFNGDGYADLAVSSSEENSTRARIYIYTGSPTGLVARPGSTIQANINWFQFGRTFATGDVTGDGIADIVVGMPTSNTEGRPGFVFIYKGSAQGYSNVPAERLVAPSYLGQLDGYGNQVAVLGDVDGDGYPDLAVAAESYASPESVGLMRSSGRVFVYYGSAQGFNGSGRMQTLAAPDEDGFSFFGEVMLGQRDFNGDGHADLIVGASMRQRGVSSVFLPYPGFVWVYTGGPGGFTKAPHKRSGPAGSQEGLGATLDAADVTGDGQMDIISGNAVFSAGKAADAGVIKVYRGAKGLK